MSLQAELDAFYQARQEKIPVEIREIMGRSAAALAASGQVDRAVAVGEVAPSFTLPSATGRVVTLAERLAEGPIVLTFYRGAWCPYCNLTLHALQEAHADIKARGAQLIAISPQIPDESLSLTEKHQLGFDVLSELLRGGRLGLRAQLRRSRVRRASVDGAAVKRRLRSPLDHVAGAPVSMRWRHRRSACLPIQEIIATSTTAIAARLSAGPPLMAGNISRPVKRVQAAQRGMPGSLVARW